MIADPSIAVSAGRRSGVSPLQLGETMIEAMNTRTSIPVRRALFVIALVAGGLCPAMAEGQNCTSISTFPLNSGSKIFRVNNTSFHNHASGVSGLVAQESCVAASEAWNHQANAAHFTYVGGTDRTSLYDTKSECEQHNAEYSIIYATPGASIFGKAATRGKCFENGVATQFEIEIFGGYDWSTGAVGASQWDLVQTLTHEFGHTLDLGHPPDYSGIFAVMEPTQQGSTAQRDLYQWDQECAHEVPSGPRSLSAYARTQSQGQMSAETMYTTIFGVSHASASAIQDNGQWDWTSAYNAGFATLWTRGFDTSNTAPLYSGFIEVSMAIGPVAALWRESSAMGRVFFGTVTEWDDAGASGTYLQSGRHRVKYIRSGDDFEQTSQVTGTLRHCSTMTGWFSCGNYEYVHSGKAIAVAWDPKSSRTITAWANQDRQTGLSSREVLVSVGQISNVLLPEPDTLSVRTTAHPGVACKGASPYTHNCIVGYVNADDNMNNVRIRRFFVEPSSDRYVVYAEGVTRDIGDAFQRRSASRITVWHHNDSFWIAFRTSAAGQDCRIYRSSDSGLSWNYSMSLGNCSEGPSAVSELSDGDNAIVIVK